MLRGAMPEEAMAGEEGATGLRRLLPRQFTDWRGKYRIEGDSDEHWRVCRVVDMSTAGTGLELLDATPEEVEGRRIILAVQLRGDVRYSMPTGTDGLRVGIQFVDLTEAERDYLESLADLHAGW
jgi:hypothetical protein